MTPEQRWIRTELANAKRGVRLRRKLVGVLGTQQLEEARAEVAVVERILAIVDVYAIAGGFREEAVTR
jgi:hypothetical protein